MRVILLALIFTFAGCDTKSQPVARGHDLLVWEAVALVGSHPNESVHQLLRDATRYMKIATRDNDWKSVVDQLESAGVKLSSRGTTTSSSTGKSETCEFVLRKNVIDSGVIQLDLKCKLSAPSKAPNKIQYCYVTLELANPIPVTRVLNGQSFDSNSILDDLLVHPDVLVQCKTNSEVSDVRIEYERFRTGRYAGYEPSGFDLSIHFDNKSERTYTHISFEAISGLDPETDENGLPNPDLKFLSTDSVGPFKRTGEGNGQWTPGTRDNNTMHAKCRSRAAFSACMSNPGTR